MIRFLSRGLHVVAPVVLNLFGGAERGLTLVSFYFHFQRRKRKKKICVQFFLLIDHTADGSMRHQGYWSLYVPLMVGCFQMQMHLNTNPWQHNNSFTNCGQTFYKHADSVRNWFLLPPFKKYFYFILFIFFPVQVLLCAAADCETNWLTVGCRSKI